jgi:hypothetical protein
MGSIWMKPSLLGRGKGIPWRVCQWEPLRWVPNTRGRVFSPARPGLNDPLGKKGGKRG